MRQSRSKDSDGVSGSDALNEQTALSPFKMVAWQSLSPAERLARAWALRERLVDPEDAHDRKLFPAP